MKHLLCTTVSVFVAMQFLTSTAYAQFFRIDELIGPAPAYGSGTTVAFDLGQEFDEVREVVLLIEATASPLTVISCGSLANPEPCTERLLPVGFLARIDDPNAGFISAVVDGFRSDRPTRNSGVFNQVFIDFDLDSLRDGKGELSLFWNQIFFFTGTAALRDRLPEGEILDAVLIVDGTPYSKKDRKWKWKRRARRR